MTQLTREQARELILAAGCPTTIVKSNAGFVMPLANLMVGIASAESDLIVEAQNTFNSNGSVDNGLWQINDQAWPQFDPTRLRTDAAYNAKAAVTVLLNQGLRAWYAYQLRDGSIGPYVRKMPPTGGGPDISYALRSRGLVVKSWQAGLNRSSVITEKLVVDGAYGPKSEAATVKWKSHFYPDGGRVEVNFGTWERAGLH